MERLIIQIAAAANMRTLYPAHHPRVVDAIRSIIDALGEAVDDGEDSVTLLIVGDDLVAGHDVLRKSTLHQRQLVEMLRRGGIERLTLAVGLDEEEADRFVAALAAGETPDSSPHIVLGRVQVVVEDESSKRDERRELTADQVDVVREAFSRFRGERRIPMAEMEQLVWGFIGSLSSSTHNMLPLAKLKDHDEYTFIHSVNVSLLVLAQARSFGIQGTMLHAIGMAALVHDIGKLLVPLDVLNTPGKLEGEAWAKMQSHAERGAWYLSELEGSSPLSILVAYEHHLRYDGKPNYPLLRVPRTPNLASRMTSIADAYDAMSTLRPYQKPQLRATALENLQKRAETFYDPLLVANFVRLVRAASV